MILQPTDLRGAAPLTAGARSRGKRWLSVIVTAFCFSVPVALMLQLSLPVVMRRPELTAFGPHSILPAVVATAIGTILAFYVHWAR